MKSHITALGAIYIGFNIMGLLIALIIFTAVAGGGLLSGDEEAIMITSLVGSIIAYFFIITSLPGIIAGYGLLKQKPWARILALILGFLNLPGIPVGTAIGIYTIWVLLKDETIQLFERPKRPQPEY